MEKTANLWSPDGIDGKDYYFNDEGHMQTGKLELNGFHYYLGDENDGVMKTGWIQLENEDEYADEDMVWHYFDSNGRMVMNQVDRKIDGSYYTFENGILQTGWYRLPVEETATASNAAEPSIASYQYYEENGKRADGWYQIEGAPEISEEGEIFTFFFKKGVPYHASAEGVEVFSVDSKRYGFNHRGELVTGLQQVRTEDGVHNFYFGDEGIMRTGKQSIYDEDLGEVQNWYFHTDGSRKGQGYHGIKDNVLYVYGLRQEADKDLRFAPVTLDDKQYLVNANGTVQKAGSSSKSNAKPELGNGFKDFKDENEKIWTVNTEGVIQ